MARLHRLFAARYSSGQTDAVDASLMSLLQVVLSYGPKPARRRIVPRTLEEVVLRALVIWPGATPDQIAEHLGRDRGAAGDTLRKLSAIGLAHQVDGGAGWFVGPSIDWLLHSDAQARAA